jgi:hypothetical protein
MKITSLSLLLLLVTVLGAAVSVEAPWELSTSEPYDQDIDQGDEAFLDATDNMDKADDDDDDDEDQDEGDDEDVSFLSLDKDDEDGEEQDGAASTGSGSDDSLSFLSLRRGHKNASMRDVLATMNALTAQSAHAVAMCHYAPYLCGMGPPPAAPQVAAAPAFGMGGLAAPQAAAVAPAAQAGFNVNGGSTGFPALIANGGVAAPGMFPSQANQQSVYQFNLGSAGLGGLLPDPAVLRAALMGPTSALETTLPGNGINNGGINVPGWWGKYAPYMDPEMARTFAEDDDKNQWRIGGEPWAMLHAKGASMLFPHGAPKANHLPPNTYPDPIAYPQYYKIRTGIDAGGF